MVKAKVSDEDPQDRRRITLQLPHHLVEGIDRLRSEWGLRSRGDTVERLIGELLVDPSQNNQDSDSASSAAERHASEALFDEAGALVLVAESSGGGLSADYIESVQRAHNRQQTQRGAGTGGIDLPGFVRRQSDQLRRSLQPPTPQELGMLDALPLVEQSSLKDALECAQQHWLELYGTAPNEHVLEAAMAWLAKEIWPQVEQSEGRPFTWSAACQIALDIAPSWPPGQPRFDKVMAMAGLLEDPFSASTLSMRIPTLIRRFVQRMRRRQRGMSFETLENTMSLHGALKLLQLPTAPGHRLTLANIREAYREQALHHHPDSGGSAEQMRRLNEAYQMLKELYRAS